MQIYFEAVTGGYAVKPDQTDACRNFCGARAYFDLAFNKPAVGCSGKEVTARHASFTTAYKKKDYRAAVVALAPVLQNCSKTAHWMTMFSYRNDFAVAQYHAGDAAGCLATLAPILEAADDDYAIAPMEESALHSKQKAANFNATLCRAAVTKR